MNDNFEREANERSADPVTNTARDGFVRRMLIGVGITVAVLLVPLLLWYAIDVLLLVFAGILLAIFLRGLSDKLSERTGLSGGWSLAVVVLALVAIIGVGAMVREKIKIFFVMASTFSSLPQTVWWLTESTRPMRRKFVPSR